MAQPSAHTVRPTSGAAALLTLVPLGLCFLVGWGVLQDLQWGGLLGCGLFLAHRVVVVRLLLCADHRRGIALTRGGRFGDALEAFRRSELRWAQRRALDRHRALLLGSAAPWGFRTMARYNQAFCLSQLGRGSDALELLEALLAEDPGNTLASSLKTTIESGKDAGGEADGPQDAARESREEHVASAHGPDGAQTEMVQEGGGTASADPQPGGGAPGPDLLDSAR